jgi:hypothetical protein
MSDYVKARKSYLERLASIRQREEEHLSVADFQLVASRLDPLIAKVRSEVDEIERLSKGYTYTATQANCSLQPGVVFIDAYVVIDYYRTSAQYQPPSYSTSTITDQFDEVFPREVTWMEASLSNLKLAVPVRSAWSKLPSLSSASPAPSIMRTALNSGKPDLSQAVGRVRSSEWM